MKRIIAMLLTLMMALSLTACSGDDNAKVAGTWKWNCDITEMFQEGVNQGAGMDLSTDTTMETVCLLSKLQSKEHIEIEVKMDELDLTSAESKATYEEIREYVFEHTGLKVSHLYIAQVKQKYGIIERENYNKPKSEDTRQPQCPPEKEKAITEALKHFGMI